MCIRDSFCNARGYFQSGAAVLTLGCGHAAHMMVLADGALEEYVACMLCNHAPASLRSPRRLQGRYKRDSGSHRDKFKDHIYNMHPDACPALHVLTGVCAQSDQNAAALPCNETQALNQFEVLQADANLEVELFCASPPIEGQSDPDSLRVQFSHLPAHMATAASPPSVSSPRSLSGPRTLRKRKRDAHNATM
eukprot:TRINITY_DN1033_c0_g1_i1.p1 TRINITY_DN1033_c0_g1~~TRINITY_DN1033_c0_g1_i1.p1  ORF type:complete len:193 (+),score=20.03 TRINITY_DN1033_c0_g1_i1:84-662(+)